MSLNLGYSQEKNYNLYNWDAFKLIKKLPDNSIDLTFTSPPYFMGKEYDKSKDYSDFLEEHKKLFPEIIRVTKDWWSICWQIGYHVKNNSIMPLDWLVYDVLKDYLEDKTLVLRNRINWVFWHWLHNSKRFSWRHETILRFTKWNEYPFDLDSVRVPQKYPWKKYFKWEKKGQYSWNPLWKNPSDVWEIPNVKAHHIEKTEHPCQFPVALVQRFIRSVVPINWVVFDPFMWSGSAWVASIIEWRRFIGSEIDKSYFQIAKDRCEKALKWELKIRHDSPIYEPTGNLAVAKKPDSFRF